MRDHGEIGEEKGGAAGFVRRGPLRGVDLAEPRVQTTFVAARAVPVES